MLGSSYSPSTTGKSPPARLLVAYGVFLSGALAVYHFYAEGEFSAVLTMSVMFQCLAFVLLSMQSLLTGSAAGISAQSLILEAVALGCRLSSTTWLDGYLPVDASGDFLFQAIDVCSLVVVLWLVHRVLVVQSDTYQASEDGFPIAPVVLGSFILATLLHGDMNDRPLFDTLWMAGLFMGVAAVLPQLWLITRTRGCIEALTSHYIAVMGISRLLSGLFMWHAREDITSVEWVEGYNHAPWAILGAHAVHLFLLGDFMYYYLTTVAKHGLECRFELPLYV